MTLQDHYAILDLSSRRYDRLTARDLKRAYRAALLTHHPDKNIAENPNSTLPADLTLATDNGEPTTGSDITTTSQPVGNHRAKSRSSVDSITTAYTILSDPRTKAEYDVQIESRRRNNAGSAAPNGIGELGSQSRCGTTPGGQQHEEGYLSGLEVVDLDDLETECIAPSSSAGSGLARPEPDRADRGHVVTAELDRDVYDDRGVGSQIWFKACRCGFERGFVVTEDELERSIAEGEVLTPCRGCSLWLKVQFSAA